MATNVEVPSVGESVTEAILLKWYKQTGERVEMDEPLCELETDKANVDIPAPVAGVITVSAGEGDTVTVGQVIASIDPAGEATVTADAPAAEAAPAPASASPAPAAPASASGGGGDTDPADLSPAVRRLVGEHNLDASKIPGTGPGGRLTKEDVLAHIAASGGAPSTALAVPAPTTPAPAAAPAPAPAPAAPKAAPPAAAAAPRPPPRSVAGQTRREPMSKLRKRIAQRLVAAQQETAMLTTFNEIDLTEVIALRKSFKEDFKKVHGVSLGFMSFFTRATSLALMEFPEVNAIIDGDDVVFHDYVNMGIAVSTERGLVVPVVRDVLPLSMAQIEGEIKRVAFAARDGKLKLDEMTGGTFTITNGGVFGSLMSTPILNRPQSGILGMHAIQERPVAVGGQVEVRPMMYVALSYDHRIIDGKTSVRFLVRIKEYLENPSRMLLQI